MAAASLFTPPPDAHPSSHVRARAGRRGRRPPARGARLAEPCERRATRAAAHTPPHTPTTRPTMRRHAARPPPGAAPPRARRASPPRRAHPRRPLAARPPGGVRAGVAAGTEDAVPEAPGGNGAPPPGLPPAREGPSADVRVIASRAIKAWRRRGSGRMWAVSGGRGVGRSAPAVDLTSLPLPPSSSSPPRTGPTPRSGPGPAGSWSPWWASPSARRA